MADQDEHDKAGTMSVRDMQAWLRDEIRDSAKAHDLRVRDATQLVEDYASGKLSTQEAADRMVQYDRRWGEALFGSWVRDGVADSEILAEIDRARERQMRPEGFRFSVASLNRIGKRIR